MNDRSCFPTREDKFDYQYMDRCEAVTVALAGMVIEKLSCLPDFVGLGSHLAVTKFSQLFEVTPLIPVVNSYSGHVQFSPDI